MKIVLLFIFWALTLSGFSQVNYKHLKSTWHQCFTSLAGDSDTLIFKKSSSENRCDNLFESDYHIHLRELGYTFSKRGKLEIDEISGVNPKHEMIESNTTTIQIIKDTVIDSLGQQAARTREIPVPQLIHFEGGKSNARHTVSTYVLNRRKNTLLIGDSTHEVLVLTEETLHLIRRPVRMLSNPMEKE